MIESYRANDCALSCVVVDWDEDVVGVGLENRVEVFV